MTEQEKVLQPKIEQSPTGAPKAPETLVKPEQTTDKKSAETISDPTTLSIVPQAGATDQSTTDGLLQESERVAEIERILEDDLSDVYFNLPENQRELFRARGETTAREINSLLSATKIRVNKIISLIKKWLTVIPGVNKFFLEQEAKLKTDQIIKLHDKF